MIKPVRPVEDEIPLPRLRTISHLWACAAVLAGLGVAAMFVDAPLANWVREGHCPSIVRKLAALGETFGHGLGVVLIAASIWVLDPWHRYALPRITAAALGSGLSADAVKLLVARVRPHHFDTMGRGLDSFSHWLPLFGASSWEQSFPSAHTATAAGLAIVLACYYPRGRWFFPFLAGLVGCQRVIEQSHFFSDVLWGAAVGCIFAPLCVYGSRLSRAFDALEVALLERSGIIEASRLSTGRTSAPSSPVDAPRAA